MLENALFGLVNAKSWNVMDVISRNFQHWCILGQRWMLQCLGSKSQGQGHSMRKGPAGGDRQLDTVCQVLISSYFYFYFHGFFVFFSLIIISEILDLIFSW